MTAPPALLDLNVELLKNGFLEVLISVCFLPFFYLDEHVHDPQTAYENGVEGSNLRKELYRNSSYREVIGGLLPYFQHKGFLN